MADPARYDTYVDEKGRLLIERCDHGIWVKWSEFRDYQNGQRRNAKSELVSSLGIEVVMLRRQLERLTKAGDRLASATIIFECMREEDREQRRADWLAAKQGRDAK